MTEPTLLHLDALEISDVCNIQIFFAFHVDYPWAKHNRGWSMLGAASYRPCKYATPSFHTTTSYQPSDNLQNKFLIMILHIEGTPEGAQTPRKFAEWLPPLYKVLSPAGLSVREYPELSAKRLGGFKEGTIIPAIAIMEGPKEKWFQHSMGWSMMETPAYEGDQRVFVVRLAPSQQIEQSANVFCPKYDELIHPRKKRKKRKQNRPPLEKRKMIDRVDDYKPPRISDLVRTPISDVSVSVDPTASTDETKLYPSLIPFFKT